MTTSKTIAKLRALDTLDLSQGDLFAILVALAHRCDWYIECARKGRTSEAVHCNHVLYNLDRAVFTRLLPLLREPQSTPIHFQTWPGDLK